MAHLLEWPELSVLTQEQRFELVLKGVDSQRRSALSDEGLQKTVFEKNPQLNFISITGCGLSYLSPSITACSQLTKLSITRNDLTSVPEEIGALSKLTFIDLSDNGLEHLPPSFSNLSKLETFVATGNRVGFFSIFVAFFRTGIYRAFFYRFSQERNDYILFKLTNEGLFDFSTIHSLLVLDLSHNNLVEVPSTVMSAELVRLHTLNLAHNKITEVSEIVFYVESEVPEQFSLNHHLKTLDLSANAITALPWAVGQLEKIRMLDLSQNPFKDGRFKKLTNDKRAKVSAVIAYISKNTSKSSKDDSTGMAEGDLMSGESLAKNETIVWIGAADFYVKRLESVVPIRPFLSCCVLSNLDLTGEHFKKFINIQTKLHDSSLCGHRTIAAIGTHELKAFRPPLNYLALPPDELHITALHKKKPVNARELVNALARDADLARKRTKRNTLNPLHRFVTYIFFTSF
uniref:Leucine-rich repeat protein n=1 Tax=Angiostrongylus cantonensis TaxID=6313 RepID=A0A158P9G5_ANGCA